jgi:hypothetical protein
MSFKDFKKNQGQIKEALDKQKTEEAKSASYVDNRFWQLKQDSAGNGSALIRFLPQKSTSKPPYVKTLNHSFNHKGKWFIEECPWTIKETCPVCMYVRENDFWNTDKKLAGKFSSKPWFIANILVIEDELNPENVGKVFLYKFGNLVKKLVDKAGEPDKEVLEDNKNLKDWYEETGGNIFDFDKGLNLRLKVSKKTINVADTNEKKAINDYDATVFRTTPTAVCDGDEKLQEKVFDSIYDLDEFFDKKRFKSSEELEKKFFATINHTGTPAAPKQEDKPSPKKEDDPPKQYEGKGKPESKAEEEEIDYDALLGDDDIPF